MLFTINEQFQEHLEFATLLFYFYYFKKEEFAMNKLNLKGVNKEAITGIAILLLALINATLQMFGINALPIENEEITNIISTLFLIATALYNTWKNRNLTTASQTAQTITDAIKNGTVLAEDIMFIVDKMKENENSLENEEE